MERISLNLNRGRGLERACSIFQYPQSVPGLRWPFLEEVVAAIRGDEAAKGVSFRNAWKSAMEEVSIPRSFLSRYVNDGFSGGEKKRFEILQLMLLKPNHTKLTQGLI